jgi:hypothetical protein
MVFLEAFFYEFLLLAHLFATFVLVGSMTHNLVCVVDYLRGKLGREELECVREEGVPSQGWYGMQAFTYVAAGVVAIVTYIVLKVGVYKKANLKPAVVKWLGTVVTAIIIV